MDLPDPSPPASPVLHLVSHADLPPSFPPPDTDADHRSPPTAPDSLSPQCSSAGIPSPQRSPAARPDAAASPRASCVDSASCSSSFHGFDKKSVSVRPSLMKKSASAGLIGATTVVRKCMKPGSAGITISVSHTEKETVVHTDTSNFREVVHQLTGAPRSDNALSSSTLAARARVAGDDASRFGRQDVSSRDPDGVPHKLIPPRLFERRRSSKTLDRICTSCKDLRSSVPSPVTPLASDFEMICLPVTPVASPVTGQQNDSLKQTPAAKSAFVQTLGSGRPCPYHRSHLDKSESTYSIVGISQFEVQSSLSRQQDKSMEDVVIAEKGFFLHPQIPRTSEPALLQLFPESPKDS